MNFGGRVGEKYCSYAFECSKEAKIPFSGQPFSG
jgi:hypothetical protein